MHGVAAHAGLIPAKGRARYTSSPASDPRARGAAGSASRHHASMSAAITGGSRRTSSPIAPPRAWTSGFRRWRTRRDWRRRLRGLRPAHPRVRLEVTGGVDRPPLERSAGRRSSLSAGDGGGRRCSAGELPEGAAGGGSDGNFTARAGCSYIRRSRAPRAMAPTRSTNTSIDDLPWRAAFLRWSDCVFE